ncbi:hypothetical protein [Gulosibacter chungangensis]|uniref:hypothetical protein n=1 Tax=Gulosibacter chungangensis TaxID=979746 RepID=UPI0017880832|nr:hypothetical protein [Gulosibacter chungangensis]
MADTTIGYRDSTHDLIDVLTASGPGDFAALAAGNCLAHFGVSYLIVAMRMGV